MVTSGRCPILKNLSVGGWSHPRLWIVWWEKKRFSQKICVLGDGQACVRAESQIEVDAHPRSVTCTHTHTEPPDSSWVLPPPNSTSTKWNLSVTGARRPSFTPYWNKLDPRRGHAHTDVQSLRQKRGWWKDEDRTERCCRLLFPAATLGLISPCYASPCSLPHAATPLSSFLFFFLPCG